MPAPRPGQGEVLIRVEAAAVNFPDTLIIQGRYQARPPFPFAPGGEVAGTVEALGEGVAGPPPAPACWRCAGHGGFAELACAPVENVVALPDGIDAVTAAALSYAYGTVLHALRDRAALAAGRDGAGARRRRRRRAWRRCRSRAHGRTGDRRRLAAKHAACREAGADGGRGLHGRRTGGTGSRRWPPAGVEVVFDAVGGPYAEPALRSLAWGGRYLVVGSPPGRSRASR